MKIAFVLSVFLFPALIYSITPAPVLKQRFFDSSGAPLSGGKIYCYVAGTTTQTNCYTNASGTVATNPVILDSDGYADIWLDSGAYKFAVYDSNDVLQFTVDNVDNGPAAPNGALVIAHRITSDQTIASSTATDIIFNSESKDDGNQFDTSNGRFTASQNMRVLVSWRVAVTIGGTAPSFIIYAVYKNGTLSDCYWTEQDLSNSTQYIHTGNCILELSAGDYITLNANSAGQSIDVDYNSVSVITALEIYEIASEIPTAVAASATASASATAAATSETNAATSATNAATSATSAASSASAAATSATAAAASATAAATSETNAATSAAAAAAEVATHAADTSTHGVSSTIVGASETQTLTNKTIDGDNNTISNLAHGAEVDNPSSGVHGVTGSVVGTTDTQTLTNKTLTAPTLTNPVLNSAVSGTAVLDEDNMASDSATQLATQQSIKAYVDAQVVSGGSEFADNVFKVQDNGDATKELAFEISGITTGTTRTITPLNEDFTMVGLASTQTLTNKTLTSPVLNTGVSGTAVLDEDNMASDSATQLATQQSIKAYVDAQVVGSANEFADNLFRVEDNADDTKKIAFEVSGITTATTRTITPLNEDFTMVGVASTQTLTNKTLTSPVLNTGVSGTAILDEDNMASDSATQLATQQSIKAYVDANGGGGTAWADWSSATDLIDDSTGSQIAHAFTETLVRGRETGNGSLRIVATFTCDANSSDVDDLLISLGGSYTIDTTDLGEGSVVGHGVHSDNDTFVARFDETRDMIALWDESLTRNLRVGECDSANIIDIDFTVPVVELK